MTAIVTKQSLNNLLQNAEPAKRVHIVGRALVALFERQTQAEQSSDHTQEDNGVGFAGADARSGSLTAKSYIKRQTLEQWQVDKWMKVGKNGFPRICKYDKQLNEIAVRKQAAVRANRIHSRLSVLRVEMGICQDSDDPAIIEPIAAQIKALEQALNTTA